MSSCLPTEILELVFACLRDDYHFSALSACARVSSVFLPVAQSVLFSHVFLLPQSRQLVPRSCSLATRPSPANQLGPRSMSLSPTEPHSRNPCVKLLQLLSTAPTLARYIRRISIIDGRLFPSLSFQDDLTSLGLDNNDTQSQHYFKIRDRLNGPQWFLSTPSHTLYSLFHKLFNIRSFDLVFQDGPKVSWGVIPQDIRSALEYLFNFPSLDTLQLRRISWNSPSSLREFTNTLSKGSIKHLILHNVNLLSFTERDSRNLQQQQQQEQHRTRGRSPTPRIDIPLTNNEHSKLTKPLTQTQSTPTSAKPNLNPNTGSSLSLNSKSTSIDSKFGVLFPF